jgi:two-component system capsular synthesis sensor histidine kinase RcsC
MKTHRLIAGESGVHVRAESAPRAIVADDEPVVRRAMARVLRDVGYAVDEAEDGTSLVSAVRTHLARDGAPPELVLTDVSMPHCDGLDALSLLSPWLEASTVLVMTGDANEQVRRRARDLGVCAVLEKPLRIDLLRDAVSGLRATGT